MAHKRCGGSLFEDVVAHKKLRGLYELLWLIEKEMLGLIKDVVAH